MYKQLLNNFFVICEVHAMKYDSSASQRHVLLGDKQ